MNHAKTGRHEIEKCTDAIAKVLFEQTDTSFDVQINSLLALYLKGAQAYIESHEQEHAGCVSVKFHQANVEAIMATAQRAMLDL